MKTLILSLIALAAVSTEIIAQEYCTTPAQDHQFAREGESIVSFATGIPYVGIVDYGYGISNSVTVGFIYGQTPAVEGYGIRFRAVLKDFDEHYRLYFRTPIFYYPETKDLGGEPWFLAWPVLNVEYRRDCGARYAAGIGAIGAVCAHSLAHQLFGGHDEDMMGFEGGLWNTFQVSHARPITEKWMAQAEIALVMNGLKIASSDDWVGGPPVVFILGLSYQF